MEQLADQAYEQAAMPVLEAGTEWVELASRNGDGLSATLHTLGGEALATTLSLVIVEHDSGVYLTKQGPLQEVAPVYKHPMNYVSREEALRAYPPAA